MKVTKMTIKLREVTPDNWRRVNVLRVSEEQQKTVASNVGILARTYAYRKDNANAYIIYKNEEMVGLLMYRDWKGPPACYVLDQFMIDGRFQGKGYGKEAVKLFIQMMKEEGKYSRIELGYTRGNIGAMKLYESCGFYHTGDDYEDEIGMALDL